MELVFPVRNRRMFEELKAGDEVFISGEVYTLRDEAHRRIAETYESCRKFPGYLKESCVFYAGPSFFPDGTLSAIGPTTSERMDAFAPLFYEAGVAATLGKGPRRKRIAEVCGKHKCLYLITFGGAASYLEKFVEDVELVEFEDLGPEAIYRLFVKRLPAVVGIDAGGNYLQNAIMEP